MKYGELTLGQTEAIVNKLGGMEGVQRFLSGELVVQMATKVWTTWRTLKLGSHKDVAAYKKALTKLGNKISDRANDILGKSACTVSPEETDVDLVVASVAELGFKDGATYGEICTRGQELGLDLCPAEVGPALREAYQDQPNGEWLIIAMEAITDSNGYLRVFGVERSGVGELWLISSSGPPGLRWNASNRFVFVRRK